MVDEEDEDTTGLLSGLLSGPSRHTLGMSFTDPVLVDDDEHENEVKHNTYHG